VSVRDKHEPAAVRAEIPDLGQPAPCATFLIVQAGNDVCPGFAGDHGPVHPQH